MVVPALRPGPRSCDTATMTTPAEQADRLDGAIDRFLSLRPRILAAAPWELAELYGTEDEARWAPPEVLAHVEEMLPFWLGEVERILDGSPSAPVPFGRVATDVVRIGIIGRDRTLPLRELFARVAADGARLAARLREMDGTDAAREGLHPRMGVMTVAAVLDRFVITHIDDHVSQLSDILASRGA